MEPEDKKAPEKSNGPVTSKVLRIVLTVLIGLGIFLRFYNSSGKEYWHDEAVTSLHISGHTKRDLDSGIIGKEVSFESLKTFYQPSTEGVNGVCKALLNDQPEKGPLFFIGEYAVTSTIGSDTGSMRFLPAIFGVLQLPAFFWLGMELFGSQLAALCIVAVASMSPFLLTYSQEAREYSMFAAVIALASAALMYAVRQTLNSNGDATPSAAAKRSNAVPVTHAWIIYGLTLTVSFFTSALTIFVWIAHLVWIVWERQWRWKDSGRYFFLSTLAAGFSFSLWALAGLPHWLSQYHHSLDWLSQNIDWLERCYTWSINLVIPFLDLNGDYFDKVRRLAYILMLALVGWSCFCVYRNAPKKSFHLLALLFLSSTLAFACADIAFGGVRSMQLKYMMPAPLVLIVCVGFALHHSLTVMKPRIAWPMIWVFVFGCEISSCLLSAQASSWHYKLVPGQPLNPVAAVLNKEANALLVSELGPVGPGQTNITQMLSLARLVKPEVRLLVLDKIDGTKLTAKIERFYLFNPTEDSIKQLRQNGFDVVKFSELNYFWIVTRDKRGGEN